MTSYFIEGPGMRYYKTEPVAGTGQGSSSQNFVLVTDRETSRDLFDPLVVAVSMDDALLALEAGSIDSAFRKLKFALDNVERLFKKQSPLLICAIFWVLYIRPAQTSEVARKVHEFVLGMALTLLGSAHPLSIIVSQAITLTSAVERRHLFRAFSKVIYRSPCLFADQSSTLKSVVSPRGFFLTSSFGT